MEWLTAGLQFIMENASGNAALTRARKESESLAESSIVTQGGYQAEIYSVQQTANISSPKVKLDIWEGQHPLTSQGTKYWFHLIKKAKKICTDAYIP